MIPGVLVSPEVTRLVGQFPRARVLVVGDVVLDEWIEGTCSTVSREAPVPAVDVGRRENLPGAAANTAVNVASLGGQVRLLSVVGDDEPGRRLLHELHRAGVDASACVVAPARATRTKSRLVAGRQVVARFDEGQTWPVDAGTDGLLAERLDELATDVDIVVIADYAGGATTGRALHAAAAGVARARPLLVDAHDLAGWRHVHPSVVTPNWVEVGRVLGGWAGDSAPTGRVEAVLAAGQRLLGRTGAESAVVTLDADGAVVLSRSAPPRHVPTRPVPDPHTAGAGDTLAAALALGLAVGADLARAAEVAVAAGTIVVQRPRTASCTAGDLTDRGVVALMTEQQLLARCAEHRRAGRRIAFTNGCFDVLHAGHLACLEAAAQHGDVVVVGLNDDEGVRTVKGDGRPLNRLADRAAILAALGPVDHIVAFGESAPLSLIEALRPDVYVKGADHDVRSLAEAQLVRQLGGSVVVVPLVPDRSTQGLIAACAAVAGAVA